MEQPKNIIISFLLIITFAATSCQSIRTSSANATDLIEIQKKPRSGNFYFLPKVLVKVNGKYIDEKKQTYVITVSRIVTADKSARYFTEYVGSSLSDDSVSFVVNSKGLIDGGFSSTTKDESGAIIENLAKTAINLWQIGSYGSLEGQISPPTAPGLASASRNAEKLAPFELVFDPYSEEAIRGKSISGFFISFKSSNTSSKNSDPLPTIRKKRKSKGGLVFRAPDIVDVSIVRNGPIHPPKKSEPASNAPLAGATEDTGVATPLSLTAEQTTNDVIAWTIHNADDSLAEVNLNASVKTADLSKNAVMSFSFNRALFVKKSVGLSFSNGELMGTNIRKPSELKALVDIPLNITTGVLEAIPSVIKINDYSAARELNSTQQGSFVETETLKNETALAVQKKALVEAQLALLIKEKELEVEKNKKPEEESN